MDGTRNAFYGQSGGVTAVMNMTAYAVIETAKKYSQKIGKVFAGKNGILGLLKEELYDISKESKDAIYALRYLPGGVFGSCRYKLADFNKDKREYVRIIEVLKAHDIGYFFYNGGNDSADTTYKLSLASKKMGYPLTCIAIPKTIDNDIKFMDNCPGFASVAKVVATMTRELDEDIISMVPETQVYILEVMGRYAGWIASSSALAKGSYKRDIPHIILFPEIPFDEVKFLNRVNECVKKDGYCFIVTSESLKDLDGNYVSSTKQVDAFGHTQMTGVAVVLANLINRKFGYKYRYSIAGYIERASRHLGSKIDLEHAYAVGKAAVKFAIEGKNNICPIINRKSSKPYIWTMNEVSIEEIANKARNMPLDFITRDGFYITKKCRDYLLPLIQGEDFPPFDNGIPKYIKLKKVLIKKKLNF